MKLFNMTPASEALTEDDLRALRSILSIPLSPSSPAAVRYALCCTPGAGFTFEIMAAQLLARPQWVACTVDTAVRKTVCCDRLAKVSVFLGEKLFTEALQDEADALRSRRRSMKSPTPAAPSKRPSCAHQAPTYSVSSDVCLLNYFRGTRELTMKDKMVRMMTAARIDHYCPQTFVIVPCTQHDDRMAFTCAFLLNPEPTLWIVKSAHGKGGEGHRIVRSVKDALRYVDGQRQKTPWIVQRYIDAPMLIHGRKFDIRVWVLVTSDFCIYLHRKGVMRTSSEPFSLANIGDDLVHLTNHCVQTQGPNYSTHEKGNEMFYGAFQAYLDTLPGPRRSFQDHVVPVMRTMVADTLLAIQKTFEAQANAQGPLRSFQFFGFDFMLDETFQLWLLEVNGAPGITADLADDMVADVIALAVDPVFNPSAPPATTDFELIYSYRQEPEIAEEF